jgi:hypothetical protein
VREWTDDSTVTALQAANDELHTQKLKEQTNKRVHIFCLTQQLVPVAKEHTDSHRRHTGASEGGVGETGARKSPWRLS